MNVKPKMALRGDRAGERGATLIEFVITATIYFMMLIGIVAISHLYFTHNALDEATRRGARHATLNLNSADVDTEIKNVVVYGTPTAPDGGNSLVANLTTDDVKVDRSGFGVGTGTVTVRIDTYSYNFVIPLISRTITMPEYRTTLTGESAGNIPANK